MYWLHVKTAFTVYCERYGWVKALSFIGAIQNQVSKGYEFHNGISESGILSCISKLHYDDYN